MKRSAKATPKPAPPAEDDPRFAALLDALAADPRLSAIVDAYLADRTSGQRKKFGSNALKVDGKIFAMLSSKGTLVVKLPKARVDAIVAARGGEYFDPGHGRLMKEWLAVASAGLSWIDLAKEAHDFVKSARR